MDREKLFRTVIVDRTKGRLEELRNYTQALENKFNADKENLSNYYDSSIEGLDVEDIRALDDHFSYSYYMIEDVHIGMYRKSTLISVYSFLESSMNGLCHLLQTLHNYPVVLDDMKGEGIYRAKAYLSKLSKIDFEPLNGEWCFLMSLNKVRNCIAHSEGDIGSYKSKDKILNIINNNDQLSLKNNRHIRVEREYVDDSIDAVEKFLEKLYQKAFRN